jgi:hypothetical protein
LIGVWIAIKSQHFQMPAEELIFQHGPRGRV